MKYIKTKDGRIIDFVKTYDDFFKVCKTKQEFNKWQKKGYRCVYYSKEYKTLYEYGFSGFYMQNTICEADTIEELCDEFVGISDGEPQMLRFVPYAYAQYWNGGVYGAIWTDKGLIYVAKMNDKGELELL